MSYFGSIQLRDENGNTVSVSLDQIMVVDKSTVMLLERILEVLEKIDMHIESMDGS